MAIAIVLFIPTIILFIECMAALLPTRKLRRTGSAPPERVNVLVPAHNEELGIRATIQALLPQLNAVDQLLVVADNCTDNTAAVAREAGATVLERQNLEQRGKGYALDFGVRWMEQDPPDVVVIVDADCRVAPGSLARLTEVAMTQHRPVQSVYLIESPPNPPPKTAISTLAVTVKNWVRLTGLYNLGMPCLLTGTGMAMPWAIIQNAPLASGNIVEDMHLGMDLAIAGHSPLFCPDAYVTSLLPLKDKAAKQQRTRWEHGHLQTSLTLSPKLISLGLRKQRLDLLVLGLDLLVPPLSLLVMFWLVAIALAGIGAWVGASVVPLILLAAIGGLILIAVLSAWAKYCRQQLPAKTLLTIPLYVLWKIPLYFAFLFKRQKAWVRTDRDTPDPTAKP